MSFNTPKGLLAYAVILSFTSCTEPFEVETDDFEALLVVEGFLSTEETHHTVRLSKAARYGSIFGGTAGQIQPQENAVVIIRENNGFNETLVEVEPGLYQTDGSFHAKIGSSYNLLIELEDGSSYISLPEFVQEVPAIDSVTYEYDEVINSESLTDTGFRLSASFRDQEDVENFYLWRMNGVYQMLTFPELHTVPQDPDLGFERIPAPKQCCATCWRSEIFQKGIRISSDKLFDGNEIIESILFIPDDGLRFSQDKYHLIIRQYSLSSRAFDFFSLLKNQAGIDGDIFDPPPATLRGNIVGLTNPEEDVIGHFWAGDVAIDSLYLDIDMLEVRQSDILIEDDCRLTSGTTTVKPSFWDE